MKWFAPDYVPEFSCIAGACRHSCCTGWEIDIDPDTLEVYRNLSGEWGERLRKHVDFDQECFLLGENERCPFLNKDGLCELILHFGPGILCQICTDHPRFRSFFSDRTEIGLGLCCEEAARLILSREEKVCLIEMDSDGEDDPLEEDEQALLQWRERLIGCAQNRESSMAARTAEIARIGGVRLQKFQPQEWVTFLMNLERLDDAWSARLRALCECADTELTEWEIPFEQLLVYLLYRHIPSALENGGAHGMLAFCLFAWQLVRQLFALQPEKSMEALIETVRLFSSEIEYSDQNVLAITEELGRRGYYGSCF